MNTIKTEKFSGLITYIYRFLNKNNYRKLIYFYICTILIAAGLLMVALKSSSNNMNVSTGRHWNYIYALYTACSALTDTGLSTTVIGTQFNYFGFIIILFLIQIGGLGFIAIKIFIYLLILKSIALRDKVFIESEKGLSKSGFSVSMIKVTIVSAIVIELLGTFGFSGYLFNKNIDYQNGLNIYHHYGNSLFYSMFTTVSSFNNAGFDIFGEHAIHGNSNLQIATSLQFVNRNIFILLYVIVFMMLGGIGFPLYYELYLWTLTRISKRSKKKHYFSFQLMFMIYSYMFFTIVAFGLLLLTILSNDKANKNEESLRGLSTNQKILNIFFMSLAARNSGFSSLNVFSLDSSTKFILIILMWIGANPFSTGGGIRSTTLFLIFISIISYFLGKRNVTFNRHSINKKIVYRSYIVAMVSIMIIIFGTFITILWTNFSSGGRDANITYSFYDIIIDLSSSFGTSGLSSGITPFLAWYLLLFSMCLMVIGQLTVSSTLLLFRSRHSSKANLYESKIENVMIG